MNVQCEPEIHFIVEYPVQKENSESRQPVNYKAIQQ
jgi:hypothetical protein